MLKQMQAPAISRSSDCYAPSAGRDLTPWPRTCAPALPAKRDPDGTPVLYDTLCDRDLPRALVARYDVEGRAVALTRAMTGEERDVLEGRAVALRAHLAGFAEHERDAVAAGLMDMFGGFRSMRQQGEDAVAVTASTLHLLRDYPAWAILRACEAIRSGNVGLDPRWAPNDPEIIKAVRAEIRFRQRTLDTLEQVLAAPVLAPRPLPRPEPKVDPVPPGDGKHALRVAADIEARRVRREAAVEGATDATG